MLIFTGRQHSWLCRCRLSWRRRLCVCLRYCVKMPQAKITTSSPPGPRRTLLPWF